MFLDAFLDLFVLVSANGLNYVHDGVYYDQGGLNNRKNNGGLFGRLYGRRYAYGYGRRTHKRSYSRGSDFADGVLQGGAAVYCVAYKLKA